MITQALLLFMLINASRANVSLPAMQTYPQMAQMALVRAKYIYNTGQWSHLGWEKSFTYLNCNYIGENLAKNFATTEQAHNALMNSPTHKANILKPRFDTVSIAVYGNITVELFCDKN